MSAQGLFGTASSPKHLWLWGGASVFVIGYGLTHLPGPIDLLTWATVAGAGWWGAKQFWRRPVELGQPRSLTPEILQQAIAQTKTQLAQLLDEAPECPTDGYETHLTEIEQSLSRQVLELQIVGTRAVGKTTLHCLLAQQTPAIVQQQWSFSDEAEWVSDTPQRTKASAQTDVVLFVVQGDLTQQEWTALQDLNAQHKRIFLILNKQDRYLPEQAKLVLEQLKLRVKGVVAAENVVAIATSPQPIKVQRHQADGSYQETWETPQPQIQPLLDRMHAVATQEVNQLVLQRAYQQTLALQQEIQTQLNRIRRDRAMPILERYQWIAAGIAFANPLPSLDMVATAAITGKMIQELAEVYCIKLSLDRATEIAGVLVKNLIQMGLVEASSQVLSAVLKGNMVTYVAGGALQGVGAAYFTRMAGLSLMELFEAHWTSDVGWQLDSIVLSHIVQRIFQQHQRIDMVKDLAQQTLRRLRPEGWSTADPVPAHG
jgi:uncharacterized protein